LRVKKSNCTFAPASAGTLSVFVGEEKKIRHVPRHIELTAVFEKRFSRTKE